MRVNLHVGNLAQLAGAVLICLGVAQLAGSAVAIVVGGAILVALANFEYDQSAVSIRLPRLKRRK